MPLKIIGHSFNSESVQSLMNGWAQLDWMDDEDLKKAEVSRRLSISNRESGIYLFFTDLESYWQRYGAPKQSGSLILSRLTLVLDFHEDFKPYAGALPWGISPDTSYEEVVSKLGQPQKDWPLKSGAVVKARWQVEGHNIDISFSNQTGRIRLIALSPAQLTQFAGRETPSLPSPAELSKYLGQSSDELTKFPVMQCFKLSERLAEINTYGEADYSKELGLELYFKPSEEFPEEYSLSVPSGQLCLSGMRYRRDLDFQSNGYLGELPWGLSFDDPPALVQQKAPGASIHQNFDRDDGSERWSTQACDIHVLYSFLDDSVYRVTLLAHGCYE
jgi:hypothetical protein